MKPRHQVSRTAIEMIKRFEGYRRKAAQLPDGRWTLGYGHVLTARQGAEVAEADAEALLLYDLIAVAHAVNELTLAALNANQFDALCAFVFNIGVENYRASSVLKRLNEGQTLHAAAAMEQWRRAEVQGERIVLDALVRRRAAEKALFLTPPEDWMPASTPMFPPRRDDEGMEALSLPPPPILEAENDAFEVQREDAAALDHSASERAVAAVGARLQQIFPEPEPQAAPTLRLTPAPEFDPDPQPSVETAEAPRQHGPTLFEVAPKAAPVQAPTPADEYPAVITRPAPPEPAAAEDFPWRDAAPAFALAVLGVLLTAIALFYADSGLAGLDPRGVRWVGGLAGISMMAFSAYMALRWLGGDED